MIVALVLARDEPTLSEWVEQTMSSFVGLADLQESLWGSGYQPLVANLAWIRWGWYLP